MVRRVVVVCAVTLALAASATAQTGSTGTSTGQSSSDNRTRSSSTDDSRPATTTFFGDTGLWYVPTAEILGKGQWSTSVYRRGTNWVQGYTNVADVSGKPPTGPRVTDSDNAVVKVAPLQPPKVAAKKAAKKVIHVKPKPKPKPKPKVISHSLPKNTG